MLPPAWALAATLVGLKTYALAGNETFLKKKFKFFSEIGLRKPPIFLLYMGVGGKEYTLV